MKLCKTIARAAPDSYAVGDVIEFTLDDGEYVQAMAVKQETNGMLFVFVDGLRKSYQMNVEDSNKGGYDASDLKVNLNGEILNRFPADVWEKMLPLNDGSFLRVPTEREIFGENQRGITEPVEVCQWEPMKLRRNRMSFQGFNGKPEQCWLATKATTTTDFIIITSAGNVSRSVASNPLVIRPVFKLQN